MHIYRNADILTRISSFLYRLPLNYFFFLVVVFFTVVFLTVVVFDVAAFAFATGATYLTRAIPVFIPLKLPAREDIVLSVLLAEYLLILLTASRTFELSKEIDNVPFFICA